MEMKKKELVLEGLSCANCSAKIETETSAIEGVTARVNFVTKTLTLEYGAQHREEELLGKVTGIIHSHEPDIEIRDKDKAESEAFLLEGLGCANCAMKMEERIGKINGIDEVSIDFVTKKLKVKSAEGKLSTSEIEKIRSIVMEIEAGTQLVPMRNQETGKKINASSLWNNHRDDLLKIGASAVLLLIAIFMPDGGLLQTLVFVSSYVLVGGEILLRASKNIRRGQVFDENFLMSIATIGAILIGEFPEGVAVMLFYQVGELFQDIAVERSRKSISELMDIRPDFANLLRGDETVKVSPLEVRVGDVILVKPGEKMPLDGTVIEGSSAMDTSALTGESMPREVMVDSDVLAGFINRNGLLKVLVKKSFGESTVSKILELVENASSKKAPTENFITKFARYYTPFVVVSALLIAVIPPLVTGGAFSEWIYRALVFLVISCPCALVVSIPLGFFGGIGGASRKGILIKGGNYLEALNEVDTVVFDKTGTLTKGRFELTEFKLFNGFTEKELLEAAAYAESYSNHPIAESILKAYGGNIEEKKVLKYEEIAGHGVLAYLEGKKILAGNRKLMEKENISFEEVESIGTIIYVAVNGTYAGHLIISDEIKADAKEAIASLKAQGIRRIIMLTGDLKAVGDKIGKTLGLDEVYSELLPQDKVEKLEALQEDKNNKGKIIFVGDGINDAPVLARADIGFAMGALGSDAAIEAADVVLMTDEPKRIGTALKIAKRTRTIVWQNIIFALGVKGIFLLLGALGFATMWEAVFADVGVTIIAVMNAMRAMNTDNL